MHHSARGISLFADQGMDAYSSVLLELLSS